MRQYTGFKNTNSLGFRFFILILILSIIIFSVYTYVSINLQTENLFKTATLSVNRTIDIIRNSTRYSMLLDRRQDVYEIMKTFGKEPGIEGIRLINKRGEIVFSDDSDEVGQKVDMKAEACYICHTDFGIMKIPSETNKERIYYSKDNHRVLGVIEPIRNNLDCSNAECHAHPVEKTVIGVLDVKMSLQEIDEAVASSTNRLLLLSLIALILILIIYLLLVGYNIQKPIKKLYYGTKQLAAGNLDYKIVLNSKNEFGMLAQSFNKMTEDLKKAYKEITDFSNTLEIKVEEKTTELKRVQSQIIQIEKMASLGKLSATVAHELNNPLAGILNYVKLIRKRFSKEEISSDAIPKSMEDLQIVAVEVQRLGNIVKNLLLFAKKSETNIKEEHLIDIVDSALALIKHHLDVNKIVLHKNYDLNDDILLCDAQQIKQALIAMFINAVEAMNTEGSLTIGLSFSETKNSFSIEITDTGIGIAEEDITNIFVPFFTTKVDGKGVGLGLAVVYGIVEKHSGRIEVKSQKNMGTTFTIYLPKKFNDITNV